MCRLERSHNSSSHRPIRTSATGHDWSPVMLCFSVTVAWCSQENKAFCFIQVTARLRTVRKPTVELDWGNEAGPSVRQDVNFYGMKHFVVCYYSQIIRDVVV